MTYSVVDIAGLNSISMRILANAAAAVVAAARVELPERAARPTVAASMYGVTTPGVTRARARLEELGYEVWSSTPTGPGGVRSKHSRGPGRPPVFSSLTTTELADELAGGILSAGPDRLDAAGQAGLPQVVSLGALDMITFFHSLETLPEEMRGRNICMHNPGVTVVRTTPGECRDLGRLIGRKLSRARGRVAVLDLLRCNPADLGPRWPVSSPP